MQRDGGDKKEKENNNVRDQDDRGGARGIKEGGSTGYNSMAHHKRVG